MQTTQSVENGENVTSLKRSRDGQTDETDGGSRHSKRSRLNDNRRECHLKFDCV